MDEPLSVDELASDDPLLSDWAFDPLEAVARRSFLAQPEPR